MTTSPTPADPTDLDVAFGIIGTAVHGLEEVTLDEHLAELPDPTTTPQDADRAELLRAAIAFRNVAVRIVSRLEGDDQGVERDQ